MKNNKAIRLLILTLVFNIMAAFSVTAEEVSTAQKSLQPAPVQMKQFEFLIGNWHLSSQRFSPDGALLGKYDGKWEAQYLDEGRMILDQVTWFNQDGSKESYFPTLRTFSPTTNQWEMSYMSSLSYTHSQSFRGQFVDGEGLFDVVVSLTPELSALAKVRFYNIKKDSLEWSMKLSVDGGDTWFLAEKITGKRTR
ncbi:hypothetical protein [Vibrio sp. 99-8-1]|uniref:hypothetical protein n=1 Tax=Vibrio sp. 99-8-1 TaxID=2607602 RepID=UPI001493B09F|nr:hypothetical protein [Vibrio sp. 99-8-1]NOI67363.1 hypothetical protein [Vibrio sp. 99-8-1]